MRTILRNRNRRVVSLAVAAGLLLGLAGTGQAADFCLFSSGAEFVLKRFRIPKPDRCAPVSGFDRNASAPVGVTGSACTAADGSRVDFSMTAMTLTSLPANVLVARHHLMRIDLPALTGTDFTAQGESTWGQSAASAAPCVPSVVEMP